MNSGRLATDEDYRLNPAEVTIWQCSLLADTNKIESSWQILNAAEQERATRFRFLQHRNRFILARGFLRQVLAGYTSQRPEQLEFSYNEYGKPSLKQYPNLQFNLSHAHEITVLAITLDCGIGVDVEYILSERNEQGIAKRFFSEQEYQQYLAVKPEEKLMAFYNAWTRKEAFIKAIGQGLSFSLQRFAVSLQPDKEVCIISIDENTDEAKKWTLYAFNPALQYVAAVASKQKVQQFKFIEI